MLCMMALAARHGLAQPGPCQLPPLNDQCDGATNMVENNSYAQDTTCATSFGDPVPNCTTNFGNGVWYEFTPSADESVTISTRGSSYDTVLAVYTGRCNSLTPIECNDNNGPGFVGPQASVSFAAKKNTRYKILAGGYGGATGLLRILAYNSACNPPTIIGNVVTTNYLTSSGVAIISSVTVTGTSPFVLKWTIGPQMIFTTNDPMLTLLIPLDQIDKYLSASNFITVSVLAANNCGFDNGTGGFNSCVVCLSGGFPVSSSSITSASQTGPNITNACGSLGSYVKWYSMAAASSGTADLSVSQSSATNCFVSVFSGPITNLLPVACNRTANNLANRLQFHVVSGQSYWLAVTNGAALTNLTYGFVPQIASYGMQLSGQFQLRSGVAPPLTYSLQAAPALSSQHGWSNLISAIFPSNGLTYLDFDATNFSRRFYRIVPAP